MKEEALTGSGRATRLRQPALKFSPMAEARREGSLRMGLRHSSRVSPDIRDCKPM